MLCHTPQQLAQLQARLDEMIAEIAALMWLEQTAWRMYGIEGEQHHDEIVVTIPEGSSHGKKT